MDPMHNVESNMQMIDFLNKGIYLILDTHAIPIYVSKNIYLIA